MPTSVFSDNPAKPPGRDNLFLWTVFLLLLAALVFVCWLGSFYVFGHPENPRAYRLLKRLNKIASPVRFLVTKAPPGEFLEAQRLFERYSPYTQLQLQRENEQLFRNYLRNYSETKKLVPYLTGKFVILRAYELQPTDLFNCGAVALTQSVDFPQLLAEVVYPTKNKGDVQEMLSLLRGGLELRLQRTHDLSAILQVGHALDGRMQVTLVPLLYGNYALKNGFGNFTLEPPDTLNVGAGFPLVRGEEVRSVLRESARRRAAANANNQVPEPPGEIVRIEGGPPEAPATVEQPKPVQLTNEAPTPPPLAPDVPSPEAATFPLSVPKATVVTTQPKQETAKPPKSPQLSAQTPLKPPVAAAAPAVAPPTNLLASSSPSSGGASSPKGVKTAPPPAAVPPQSAASTTAASTTAASTSAASTSAASTSAASTSAASTSAASQRPSSKPPVPVPGPAAAAPVPPKPPLQEPPRPPEKNPSVTPLKPFIAAAPTPSVTQSTGSWKMLSPGKQTQGRSVTTEQATNLQGRNDKAPLYLYGKFVVTAAAGNRAVLRTNSNSPGAPKARVIVEYPAGGVPPQQGSSIAREDGRGFEIREVRRSPDGQVNIYVREVTSQ